MSKGKKRKKAKTLSQMEVYNSIRKPQPPTTKVMNPKKNHDRKDKSWMSSLSEEGD